LKAYSTVRQPRVQKVWEDSRRAGDLYDGRASADSLFLDEMKAMWAHVWDYPQDKGLNDAVALLTEMGVFANAWS
jgi:salicylate hydroxylase